MRISLRAEARRVTNADIIEVIERDGGGMHWLDQLARRFEVSESVMRERLRRLDDAGEIYLEPMLDGSGCVARRRPK